MSTYRSFFVPFFLLEWMHQQRGPCTVVLLDHIGTRALNRQRGYMGTTMQLLHGIGNIVNYTQPVWWSRLGGDEFLLVYRPPFGAPAADHPAFAGWRSARLEVEHPEELELHALLEWIDRSYAEMTGGQPCTGTSPDRTSS